MRRALSVIGSWVIAVWLILVTAAAFIGLLALWPIAETAQQTIRSATANASSAPVHYQSLHLPHLHITLSPDVTVFMLAGLAGVLGALVHTLTRLTQSPGGKVAKLRTKRREMLWFVVNPIQGGLLAVLIIAAVQAGLLTTGASASAAAPLNLFTIAAIGGLAGLFSKRMTTKLAGLINSVAAPPATNHSPGTAVTPPVTPPETPPETPPATPPATPEPPILEPSTGPTPATPTAADSDTAPGPVTDPAS